MNEVESLLKRSSEEREKIFRRYERGREPGAEIDPWEDPGFEIYDATDRYGFIHDKRLPTKPDTQDSKKVRTELERQKKWLKMLKNWDTARVKEKLHQRVYKGIPNSMRTQAWQRLLNVEKVKTENRGVYAEMCTLARQYSTDARQIDSDVNRQFRDHMHYRERYSTKQQSLFNVLTAYAMYNSEVGYCQGMSGLAGVLLMYMDEEDAFWAVHILLTDPKYAMHGLYREGFPKLTRFLAHHDRILTKFLPSLKKHFDKHSVDAILYSLKWFFVCFIERVPFSLCLRVWDVHLLDGERVITAMAYTILKIHKNSMLKLHDMDSIVHYIQVKLYKDFGHENDKVIEKLEENMSELRRAKLDHPGPAQGDEIPTRPFGVFTTPSFNQIVGFRAEQFSEKEKTTNQIVLNASDEVREAAIKYKKEAQEEEEDEEAGTEEQHEGQEIRGLAGSKFSFDPSIDDASSLHDTNGSRRSLADTSVTSTADLSVFSTITRSQVIEMREGQENSYNLDTHSNMSDNSVGGVSSIGSGVVVQRALTATPRSPDVLRIYVPYSAPPNTLELNANEFNTTANTSTVSTPINNSSKQQNGVDSQYSPNLTDSNDSSIITTTMNVTTSTAATTNNKVRIKIDGGSGSNGEEAVTPLVEHGKIKHFQLDEKNTTSPVTESHNDNIDLK